MSKHSIAQAKGLLPAEVCLLTMLCLPGWQHRSVVVDWGSRSYPLYKRNASTHLSVRAGARDYFFFFSKVITSNSVDESYFSSHSALLLVLICLRILLPRFFFKAQWLTLFILFYFILKASILLDILVISQDAFLAELVSHLSLWHILISKDLWYPPVEPLDIIQECLFQSQHAMCE